MDKKEYERRSGKKLTKIGNSNFYIVDADFIIPVFIFGILTLIYGILYKCGVIPA